MKITIRTYGSRGDVQPFLPLSLELLPRGKMIIHHAGAGTTSTSLRAGYRSRIRGENGVKCAVELIEEHLLNWKSAQYFKV